MKKSIRALTAWLLFICIVLGAFAPMTASAAAKDWAGYDCVAYARAHFAEYWGFELHWPNGNAQGYYYNAASFGDTVSSIPKVGALAVWGDSTYGHVAFVEQVSGNSVYISEGGYLGRYNERWKDLSSMDISWSGGYQTFLGFVYVKGTVTPPAPAQDPWIEVRAVSNITETDAKLNANIKNPSGSYISTIGVSVWDAGGNLLATHYEATGNGWQTRDDIIIYFKMNEEVGLTLTKGTLYQYQIFAIRSDNKAFYSNKYTFKSADSHTVSFHPEGGTCATTQKSLINGEAYGDLPVPQRPGYTFDGWYAGQNKITAGSIFRLSNGLDLYAHWNKVVIPGDLDGDGSVTIRDVMEACKVLARQSAGKQPTADEMARGNLDGDNAFTINDVMEICKILARGA